MAVAAQNDTITAITTTTAESAFFVMVKLEFARVEFRLAFPAFAIAGFPFC